MRTFCGQQPKAPKTGLAAFSTSVLALQQGTRAFKGVIGVIYGLNGVMPGYRIL